MKKNKPKEKLIRGVELEGSESVWLSRNKHWTIDDNNICKKAEKSGVLVYLDSGQHLLYLELVSLASEYDKIKPNRSVDDFMKEKGIGKRDDIPFY